MLKDVQVLNFPIDRPNETVTAFLKERGAKTLDIFPDQPAQEGPWHVLHVRSNFERRVARHLTVRTVEHYLPLYRERVRWTDRAVVTARPLFSGYVFARFSPESRITVISIPGVVRSLGDDEGHLVKSADLEKIREGLASGLLLRPHPALAVGARVRIRSGIFEGVEGFVTEFRQQCKVIIALAAVQQCFSLEVELGDIEVLKKSVASVNVSPCNAFGYWNLQPAKRR
jgi:transcription antitermination factor NusG